MGVNILKQVQNDGGEFFKNTVVLNLQFLLIYCLVFYEKLFLNIFLLAKKYFQGLVSLKGELISYGYTKSFFY